MATPATGDGLVRWLLGGLVVGGIVLGLLVGAYEIGYHRGKEKRTAPAAATAPATTTAAASTSPSGSSSGAALVAEGRRLFTADACSGCHSLDGSPGAGPTLKGLPGSSVTLADGTSVTADDQYLAESITDPDKQIVKGYQPGIMSATVKSLNLDSRKVDALVAYLKTQG